MTHDENVIHAANSLSRKLLRQQIKPLLVLFVIGAVLNLNIEARIAELTLADESVRWVLQLIMGIWDLFEGLMIFLVLCWGIPKVHPPHAGSIAEKPFASSYLGSFMAEYFRMIAQVILWGLLFIVPGVIRYVRLIFVPYIAIFSKRYRADEVDALKYSTELTRGRSLQLFAVFALTTAVQVAIEFIPHLQADLHFWPLRLVFMAISYAIGIWTFSILFVLFEKAMSEHFSKEK